MTPLQLQAFKRAGGTITVFASERSVTLAGYISAWNAVKAAPAGATFSESLRSGKWTGGSHSREEILGQFSEGLHDRINRHLPWFGRGRKWDHDWQMETRRAADQVNQPRLRIHWLPEWLRARFSHRICRRDD